MLYGARCWATKKHEEVKVHVFEMCMLRRMCGVFGKDRTRNQYIRSIFEITSVEEKKSKNILEMVWACF